MSVVANVAINVDSSGAVSKLRQVQTQATATQRAFGALQSAIAGIGIASIAAQTVKAAASFNDLQTRLKLLTSEYGEYTQAQQFAAKAAKQFGLSNREAATSVADIYGRLRPLGVSLKDIQSTFNGFNTIARLSGVSAEGASAAFLQLGQALGSGQLQGDEFRSIAEQIPGLLVAVSKETGIAAKDLKDFASDGDLTSDIVINALKRIESEGAGKIATLIQGSDVQKFKDLQNAVDDLSVAVGNELLPIVTPLIKDLTSLVGTIAALPDPVKNATGEIIKLIIQLLLVEKAIKAIIGLNAAFVAAQVAMAGATATTGAAATTSAGAFALYTANARTLQATSVAATASVGGLAGALLGLAAIGIITVGINYVITQTGAILGSSTAAGKSEAAGTAGGLAAQLKGKSAAERKQMLAAAQKNLANDRKLASTLSLQIKAQESAMTMPGEGPLPSDRSRLTEIQARINTNQARIKAIQTAPVVASQASLPNAMGTPIGATVGDGASGKKKGKTDAEREAERAAKEAKRLAEQIAQQKSTAAELLAIETGRLMVATTAEPLQQKITAAIVRQADIQREYNEKLKESKSAEETLNLQLAQRNAIGVNALELQQALTQEVDSLTEPLQSILNESKARLELENRYQKLLADGVNPELAKEFAQLELTAEKQTQLLTLRLGELEAAKAKLSAESAVALALQDQIDKIKEILKLQGQAVDNSKQETEEEKKKREQREKEKQKANELKDLYKGIGDTVEDGIVASLSAGIDALLNGTKDLDDALKDIAKGVLQEIANMLIKFAVRQAFAAFAGGAADGATFANGVAKFASGGIVGSPTLFQFADGGTTKTGLMGEAGPEAIMPLKRGADGKLGVAANLDGAMSRYRRSPGAAGGGGESGDTEGGTATAAAGPMVVDVRYSVERINDVEYVTASQFQAGMQQAAQQGATQGEQRTLRKLQMSSSTRRRIGV